MNCDVTPCSKARMSSGGVYLFSSYTEGLEGGVVGKLPISLGYSHLCSGVMYLCSLNLFNGNEKAQYQRVLGEVGM